jgi:signal transduction histidine kinase
MRIRLLLGLGLVFASGVLATLVVGASNFRTERFHETLGNQICTAITPQAQAGGARSSFDQAYAILRISSHAENSYATFSDGQEEYGQHPPDGFAYQAVKCPIEGRPDMGLTLYFEKAPLWGNAWLLATFIITATVMLLGLAFHVFSSRIVRIVQAQLESGMTLVLEGGSLPRGLGQIFEKLLASTPAIRKLKRELDEKHQLVSENTEFRARVSSLAEENSERVQREKTNAEVVSQVRHDLRSPLSYLKVFGQTLNANAETYHLSVQKIDRILRDLNKVAGAEVRSGETGERCLVECVLAETVAAKRVAWRRPVDLSLDFDKRSLTLVAVDRVRLGRIVDNLLQNAFEAVGEAGKIQVQVRKTEWQVEVRISDNGTGIPEDVISRFGSERITMGKPGGNGIGLQSAKQWVDAWGGTISIESFKGAGTTVSVRLPWVHTAAQFLGEIPLEFGQELVVVDDEREIAEQLIRRFGGRGRCFDSIASYAKWLDNVDIFDGMLVSVFDLHLRPGSGLDLLRLHPQPHRAVLHTDDYLNAEAIELSAELGFGILPKGIWT